jgi:vrille protein
MVAEFVARQSGSPINGETPSLKSSMPGTNSSLGGVGGQDASLQMGMSRPGSPDSDSYPPGYDLAGHLKRKELFSQRKQREFIPDNKKDESYWDRRRRNNEAAKRSREKRRFNDMILETRVVELSKENHVLKAQLAAIKDKYGINGENVVSVEQVMATLPTSEQVLSITKRPKLAAGASSPLMYHQTPSPIPTSVIHQPISTDIGSPPPLQALHHYQPQPPTGQLPLPHQHESNGYPEPDAYPYNYPLHSLHPPPFEGGSNNNALNLSRSRGNRAQSPFELSSGSGDENSVPGPVALTTGPNSSNNHNNNSLPHKLRHKTHLGDKDAATALLSLQNIKQEPGVGHGVGSRASPPWDAEGSSDERDSGISLGVEWGGHPTVPAQLPHGQLPTSVSPGPSEADGRHLKCEIARLSSEVATLKSIITRKTSAYANRSPSPANQPQ